MNEELERLKERITRLRDIHVQSVGAFNAYEQLLEHRAPNIHGRELARVRARAIGNYKGFFNVAEYALNTHLHIAVAKLFDSHRSALHIEKLINYAEANQTVITAAQQDTLDDDSQVAAELATVYRGLSRDEILSIRADMQAAQEKIARLKEIRDKKVAHTDLTEPDDLAYLSYEEFLELIALSEKILNLISRKLYGNLAIFDSYAETVVQDTKSLLRLVDRAAGIEEIREP